MAFFESLGKATISLISDILNTSRVIFVSIYLFFAHLSDRRKAVSTVLHKQIYFTGIEAFTIISWMALVIGIIIVTQASTILPLIGQEGLIGDIMVLVIIRELGPLFAGIIVIARSGSAIAAELASMKINQEVLLLESMGIDTRKYLIMPRVIGTMVSVSILTLYFEIISILGGFLLAGFGHHISFSTYSSSILESIGFTDIFISVLKSIVFGLIIGSIATYYGLQVNRSITEIPQKTTKAVIQSLFMLFALDGIITLIFYYIGS